MKNVLEPFLGSIGITLVGIFSIPFVAKQAGVTVDSYQAFKMSLMFTVGRFLYLLALRCYFHKKNKS